MRLRQHDEEIEARLLQQARNRFCELCFSFWPRPQPMPSSGSEIFREGNQEDAGNQRDENINQAHGGGRENSFTFAGSRISTRLESASIRIFRHLQLTPFLASEGTAFPQMGHWSKKGCRSGCCFTGSDGFVPVCCLQLFPFELLPPTEKKAFAPNTITSTLQTSNASEAHAAADRTAVSKNATDEA